MKLSSLAPQIIEKIRSYRYDRIIEKHEGPENWGDVLDYYSPEFVETNGYTVLLPISQEQHPNITILRSVVGDHEQTLVLFLKDVTYAHSPEEEMFNAGFVAICDRVPGEKFYVAIVYHEWFIIE